MTEYANKLDEDVAKLQELTKKLEWKPKDMVAGAME
jgi:iron uptake system EfeUOB component EfeO/EfeM